MTIKINTSTDSFGNSDDGIINNYMLAEQLNKIFTSIVSKTRNGVKIGYELDINGNIVCEWEV